jgi:hypothetical protein
LASDVSGTTYQLTPLVPTTSYIASVTANNNSVFPGLPTSVSFTTGGFPVVTGLVVSSIDVSSASISWNSVGGGYTYNVYRGATFLANESGTSYSLTGLTATTAYTVSVRVTDGTNQGSPASTSFTTATPLTVTASAVTGSDAIISWTSAGSGYLYNLQILQGSTAIVTQNGLTDLSYSVVDLSESTTYIASVRFTSSGFTSSSAYTTTFTTTGPITFSFSDPPPNGYGTLTQTGTVTDNVVGFSTVSGNWIGKQFNRMTLPLQCNSGTSVTVNVYNYPPTNEGNITNIGSATQVVPNANMNSYTFNFNSTITLIYNGDNVNGTFIIISCNSGTITVPTYNRNGIFPPVTMVALKGQSAGSFSTYNQSVFACQFFLM